MAKEEKKPQVKEQKPEKVEAAKPKGRPEEEDNEILVRIMGYDIPGSKQVFIGLTRIKGISWAISNAVCNKLSIPNSKRIVELTKPEIAKIEDTIKNLEVPDFLKNRRSDPETGKTEHLFGVDLDMRREFDIKRMKEMKSYKGVRHASRLPVRGQRTRSHFRTKSAASGMKKAKKVTA